jgi:hypothetical protein
MNTEDEYRIPEKTLTRIRAAQARQRQREAARARWVLVNEDGHALEEREGISPPDDPPDGHRWESSTPGRIEADAKARAALLDERLAERNRLAALETSIETGLGFVMDRAELVNEAYDLVMRKLSGAAPPEPPTPSGDEKTPAAAPDPKDEEIERLRNEFILADEKEDEAIKRLALEYQALRSLFVGGLFMDPGQKRRFEVLSTRAGQTWLKL